MVRLIISINYDRELETPSTSILDFPIPYAILPDMRYILLRDAQFHPIDQRLACVAIVEHAGAEFRFGKRGVGTQCGGSPPY